MTTFELYPLRFLFAVRRPVDFAECTAANTIRGSFGAALKRVACIPDCASDCPWRGGCPYARIFEPSSIGAGPSGLANLPRPFVFRAAHLDGHSFTPGQTFHFDLHLFDARAATLSVFISSLREVWRGRAELLGVSRIGSAATPVYMDGRVIETSPMPMILDLDADGTDTARITVRFKTPTELKAGQAIAAEPEFAVLFARIRDRVSMLRRAYGAGPLDIDYRGMGERAARIRTVRYQLRQVEAERRSGRTAQTHSLGGFVGEAEYEGELAEFLPYLRAAKWTGAGRQTVWGKGEIEVVA